MKPPHLQRTGVGHEFFMAATDRAN
jgi:hypothetical protein